MSCNSLVSSRLLRLQRFWGLQSWQGFWCDEVHECDRTMFCICCRRAGRTTSCCLWWRPRYELVVWLQKILHDAQSNMNLYGCNARQIDSRRLSMDTYDAISWRHALAIRLHITTSTQHCHRLWSSRSPRSTTQWRKVQWHEPFSPTPMSAYPSK